MAAIDLLLFRAVNGMAGDWPLLDWFMKTAAQGTPPAILVGLALLWFWPGNCRRERRAVAVLTALAVLVALGASLLPRLVYYRPRPFEVHDVTVLVQTMPEPSFPSAHTSGATAAATVFGVVGPWTGYLTAATAVLTALARVYVGVHYPSDVAAGLVIGWLSGALFRYNRDALNTFAHRIAGGMEELL